MCLRLECLGANQGECRGEFLHPLLELLGRKALSKVRAAEEHAADGRNESELSRHEAEGSGRLDWRPGVWLRMSILSGIWLAAALGAGASAPMPAAESPGLELRSSDTARLRGCKAADLEKQLRDRLGKSRQFQLSAGDGPTPLALEILECSLFELRRRVLISGGRPVRMPTESGGEAYGAESETGLRVEGNARAVLKARLGAGDRFVAIASGPKDKNLREATDSLRRAIEEALRERGTWLLQESK